MAKMTAAEREKKTPKFLKKLFSSPKKEKAKSMKASIASGKANKAASEKMKAAEKKYAKESMFAKAADARDKAKTTPGEARPFKEAFDAATKAGKER